MPRSIPWGGDSLPPHVGSVVKWKVLVWDYQGSGPATSEWSKFGVGPSHDKWTG
jgi:hypothetical protein